MDVLSGNIRFLKASERAALEKLSQRRGDPNKLVDVDLARKAADLAQKLELQIGLLISRDGKIQHVVVGSKDRLYLPDLGRFRLDSARLRRLRLIVFLPAAMHRLTSQKRDRALASQVRSASKQSNALRDEVSALTIPDDFLTDLEKLRLDAVLIVAVTDDGDVGPVSFACLDSEGAKDRAQLQNARRHSVRCTYGRDLFDLEISFESFISELEVQLSQRFVSGYETGKEKAILVGAYSGTAREATASMEELQELVRTAGISVADVVTQRRPRLDPKTVIGRGKVEDIVLRALERGADLIIFDRELSPGQLRNVTDITELRVIDRSMLILDIFAQRAQSSEGRLQVELAQLRYSLPRLTEKDSGLSRLTGGIGGRGPGETKLEISRRRARDRISDLEKKIDKLAAQRGVRRQRRQERGVPVVAIVGYTNSGKSTLLNALTKSEVIAESKMFATLDPSSRRMRFPNNREIVFVDTVGFIRELPKELVNAFRATLEEVGEADLLIHLVDASSPEMTNQIQVVQDTLTSLEFGDKPKLLVLNKADLLGESAASMVASSLNAIAISAVDRTGLDKLLEEIQTALAPVFRGLDPGHFISTPL